MSDYIDTREGWREVDDEDAFPVGTVVLQQFTIGQRDGRRWVREEPVPPLPTEDWTVIRAHWKNGNSSVLMMEGGTFGGNDIKWVEEHITGWEPLAEPLHSDRTVAVIDRAVAQARSETAKAVLDRLLTRVNLPIMNTIAKDYGVVLNVFRTRPEPEVPPVKLPPDTGLSHEAFAESYPNEVQWHYDGGFKDGVKTLLARIATEPWAREIDLTKWREEFGVDHG